MYLKLLAVILFIAVTLDQFSSPQKSQAADLILHNGFIWTVDNKNSTAQAVAIRDGKFVFVGSDKEVMNRRGPQTQVIDLRGAFATPGFSDNHVHFASAAQFLEFNIMKRESSLRKEMSGPRFGATTASLLLAAPLESHFHLFILFSSAT